MREIIHKYYEDPHPLLGRIVHHDSESRKFPFPTAGLTIQSVVHARHIPIMDQKDAGSCTADAGIGDLGSDPMFGALPASIPYSLDQSGALKLYSDEEVADGGEPYPEADLGSSGLTCAQVLKAAGLISGYQHCFDPQSALLALSVTPFMFGTDWQEKMMDPDPDGRVHPEGEVIGGHEILCREYDLDGDKLWFDNSWNGWGVDGRFYLTVKDFEHLLKKDGDVTILRPLGSVVTPIQERHHRHHRHHHHHK